MKIVDLNSYQDILKKRLMIDIQIFLKNLQKKFGGLIFYYYLCKINYIKF